MLHEQKSNPMCALIGLSVLVYKEMGKSKKFLGLFPEKTQGIKSPEPFIITQGEITLLLKSENGNYIPLLKKGAGIIKPTEGRMNLSSPTTYTLPIHVITSGRKLWVKERVIKLLKINDRGAAFSVLELVMDINNERNKVLISFHETEIKDHLAQRNDFKIIVPGTTINSSGTELITMAYKMCNVFYTTHHENNTNMADTGERRTPVPVSKLGLNAEAVRM